MYSFNGFVVFGCKAVDIIFQLMDFNGCGFGGSGGIFDELLVIVSLELKFMLKVFDGHDEFVGGGAFVGGFLIASHGVVGLFRGGGINWWWGVVVGLDVGIFGKSHGLIIEVRFGRCCHCGEELSAEFVCCWSRCDGWFIYGVGWEEGRC